MPESSAEAQPAKHHVRRRVVLATLGGVLVLLAAAGWLTLRGLNAKSELEASLPLVSKAQAEITAGDAGAARATVRSLAKRLHTARDDTSDPVWRAAEYLPWLGPNLAAVRVVAGAASHVADGAMAPLADLAGTVNLSSFAPVDGRVPLEPLVAAAPALTRANAAMQSGLAQVRSIDTAGTARPVGNAVGKVLGELTRAAAVTDGASRAASILPGMLGADGPRNYLLVVQNNAEARSTGGIVGALAVIHTDRGSISLGQQASAADFPVRNTPVLPLSAATRKLYGDLPGEFVQDATLTPDFATGATAVRAMWKQRFGTDVDGVVSVDPVALGYLLKATGPVEVGNGVQLTSDNAVKVLLSESYGWFDDPRQQDAFFAGSAAAMFAKVASGQFDRSTMLSALAKAADERRLLVWSARRPEQAAIAGASSLAGGLPESGAQPRFGVYLNDATGAKMDYYLHTGIGLGTATCRKDGRPNYLVQVKLSSDAPANAAQSLPGYVTGAGLSGVPAGDTYTTVAVYAPPGFVVVGAATSGKQVPIQRVTDAKHGVAQLLVKLHPGQNAVYSFQFVGVQAKQPSTKARAAQVQSTPGVWPTQVQAVPFSCADIMR